MRDRVVFDKPPDLRGNVALMGPAGCPTGFVGQDKNREESQVKLAKWHVENNAKMLTRIGQATIYGHAKPGPPGESLLRHTTTNATKPGGGAKWAGSTALEATAEPSKLMASTAPPAYQSGSTPPSKSKTPPKTPPAATTPMRTGSKSAFGSELGGGCDATTRADQQQARAAARSPNTGGELGGQPVASGTTPRVTPPSPMRRSPAQLSKKSSSEPEEDRAAAPMTLGVDLLIDGLRRRMQAKSLDSVLKIHDFFKKVDADGSGYLSYEEFRDGLKDNGVLKSDAEARLIFSHFDADRSGSIAWGEFLTCIRGQLPEARRKVVREAFNTLDISGDGVLTVEDLMRHYKSYQHPDVLSGVRTEEELYGEMLVSFDTINRDGQVSLSEFELYYEDVSALIDRDEFFEMMVRNCWHLPGAQGGHCTRLHVTFGVQTTFNQRNSTRGSLSSNRPIGQTIQEMIELRPDIGLNKQDPDFFNECKRRLEAMGYTDIERIEVLGRY